MNGNVTGRVNNSLNSGWKPPNSTPRMLGSNGAKVPKELSMLHFGNCEFVSSF